MLKYQFLVYMPTRNMENKTYVLSKGNNLIYFSYLYFTECYQESSADVIREFVFHEDLSIQNRTCLSSPLPASRPKLSVAPSVEFNKNDRLTFNLCLH